MIPSPPPDSTDHQKQQPRDPASLISPGASASSLLPGLCFPPLPCPLGLPAIAGDMGGGRVGSRDAQPSPGGECGSAREEALGTGAGTLAPKPLWSRPWGLGRGSAPPDTLVVVYAERDTQFWAESLLQVCFAFCFFHTVQWF